MRAPVPSNAGAQTDASFKSGPRQLQALVRLTLPGFHRHVLAVPRAPRGANRSSTQADRVAPLGTCPAVWLPGRPPWLARRSRRRAPGGAQQLHPTSSTSATLRPIKIRFWW